MAHVFITGSSDGLGLTAARLLIDQGHEVVLDNFGGSPLYNPQYSYYGTPYYYPNYWNYSTGYPNYYPGYNYAYGYPYYG